MTGGCVGHLFKVTDRARISKFWYASYISIDVSSLTKFNLWNVTGGRYSSTLMTTVTVQQTSAANTWMYVNVTNPIYAMPGDEYLLVYLSPSATINAAYYLSVVPWEYPTWLSKTRIMMTGSTRDNMNAVGYTDSYCSPFYLMNTFSGNNLIRFTAPGVSGYAVNTYMLDVSADMVIDCPFPFAANKVTSNCTDCLPNYYSSACLPCTNIPLNGVCNDGLSGNGTWTCKSGYVKVDNECLSTTCISPQMLNSTSGYCNACKPQYYSNLCLSCSVPNNSTCLDGYYGSGGFTCNRGFVVNDTNTCISMCSSPFTLSLTNTSATCYACVPNYYGSNCTLCPTYRNATCNSGYYGDGGFTCNSGYRQVGNTCQPNCITGYRPNTVDPMKCTLISCPTLSFIRNTTTDNCDSCRYDGYYGSTCTKPCVHPTGLSYVCDQGYYGTGNVTCAPGYEWRSYLNNMICSSFLYNASFVEAANYTMLSIQDRWDCSRELTFQFYSVQEILNGQVIQVMNITRDLVSCGVTQQYGYLTFSCGVQTSTQLYSPTSPTRIELNLYPTISHQWQGTALVHNWRFQSQVSKVVISFKVKSSHPLALPIPISSVFADPNYPNNNPVFTSTYGDGRVQYSLSSQYNYAAGMPYNYMSNSNYDILQTSDSAYTIPGLSGSWDFFDYPSFSYYMIEPDDLPKARLIDAPPIGPRDYSYNQSLARFNATGSNCIPSAATDFSTHYTVNISVTRPIDIPYWNFDPGHTSAPAYTNWCADGDHMWGFQFRPETDGKLLEAFYYDTDATKSTYSFLRISDEQTNVIFASPPLAGPRTVGWHKLLFDINLRANHSYVISRQFTNGTCMFGYGYRLRSGPVVYEGDRFANCDGFKDICYVNQTSLDNRFPFLDISFNASVVCAPGFWPDVSAATDGVCVPMPQLSSTASNAVSSTASNAVSSTAAPVLSSTASEVLSSTGSTGSSSMSSTAPSQALSSTGSNTVSNVASSSSGGQLASSTGDQRALSSTGGQITSTVCFMPFSFGVDCSKTCTFFEPRPGLWGTLGITTDTVGCADYQLCSNGTAGTGCYCASVANPLDVQLLTDGNGNNHGCLCTNPNAYTEQCLLPPANGCGASTADLSQAGFYSPMKCFCNQFSSNHNFEIGGEIPMGQECACLSDRYGPGCASVCACGVHEVCDSGAVTSTGLCSPDPYYIVPSDSSTATNVPSDSSTSTVVAGFSSTGVDSNPGTVDSSSSSSGQGGVAVNVTYVDPIVPNTQSSTIIPGLDNTIAIIIMAASGAVVVGSGVGLGVYLYKRSASAALQMLQEASTKGLEEEEFSPLNTDKSIHDVIQSRGFTHRHVRMSPYRVY
jgi:hypothetical protein